MTSDLARLQQALGHAFASPRLLLAALTHRSHGTENNERLEFLGDGLLNFLIAEALYARFPELPEGDLSRLRANLVRQDSLYEAANRLQLGEHLRLGDGELRSGGRRRPSILADAYEAVIAAIYLDGGFDAARRFVAACFAARIGGLDPQRDSRDAKTRLQEVLQARRSPLPSYRILATQGEAHAQAFEVSCEIADPPLTTRGSGSTRRIAEQDAASAALRELGE